MSENAARALIVDDAPINRMILVSMLASYGVNSDEAENGKECLTLCREHSYDLIFLDQRMPELDGANTMTQLKELFKENDREIPVICHTAEDSFMQPEIYQTAGYADVLSKPAQPKQLCAILVKYLPDGTVTNIPAEVEESERIKTELALLPDWLNEHPDLNLSSAIAHCQTAKDLLNALSVFAASVSEKADELEQFLQQENWKQYTMRVHSLKSIARLIGADELADLAAEMETAGEQTDTEKITQTTPKLLEKYRALSSLSSHMSEEPSAANADIKVPEYARNSIIFIVGDEGFLPNAIANKLRTANFDVICLPDNMDLVSDHQNEAEILLYYLPKTVEQALRSTPVLANLCHTEHKTLCLAGEPFAIERVQAQEYRDQVYAFYQRPIDTDELVADMKKLSASHDEFYRLKNILVVDDDPAFQQVVSLWLSEEYNVVVQRSGADALSYLEKTRPDLILLDYEMPEIDGYQVLEQVRQNPMTAQIPVIFLTGQNDKDRVMRILHQKPDGYLLKSASKEELLNTLNRFFVSSILNQKK